jgi:cysteine-rich repeat protein
VPSRRRRLVSLLPALFFLAFSTPASADALEAIGPPSPANGEEPGPPRCEASTGFPVKLRAVAVAAPEASFELHMQVTDEDGAPLGEAVVVAGGLDEEPRFALACDKAGRLYPFWATPTNPCLRYKRYNDRGDFLDGPTILAAACDDPVGAHIDRAGKIWIAMRRQDETTARWDRLVGAFDLGGSLLAGFKTAGPAAVGPPARTPPGPVSFVSEDGGTTAAGYLEELADNADLRGAAVALFDATGLLAESAGSVFPLLLTGEDEIRLARADIEGEFDAYVFSERWGRWTRTPVARTGTPATPTARVSSRGVVSGPPSFGTGVRIDASKKFRLHRIGDFRIETRPGGGWTIANQAAIEYTNGNPDAVFEAHVSTNEGRSFLSDFVAREDLPPPASAAGTLIAVSTNELRRLVVSRSTDGGATWVDSEPGARFPPETACQGDLGECSRNDLTVAPGPQGRWLIVWRGDVVDAKGDRPSMVKILASADDGETWTTAGTVAEFDEASADWGQTVVFGSATRAMVAWRDPDIRALATVDGGTTWTVPSLVAELDSTMVHDSPGALELAALADGSWIAVFDAADFATRRFGSDGDIFAAVSNTTVSRWEEPVPLNPWAATDAAVDRDPTVAFAPLEDDPATPAYATVAAWTSHQPVFGPADLDADIFAAHTSDGLSWSDAVALHADAGGDARWDGPARLAANELGSWLLVARERDLLAPDDHLEDFSTYAFYARCGNARVGDTEECDDGNLTDGDGCDGNCTTSRCGNGIRAGDEPCDDGNDSKRDSCRKCVAATCGDRVRWPEMEACDDGNNQPQDGCDASCRIEDCGNGAIDDPLLEECDDGNFDEGDGCSFCRFEECGNGVRQADEECDDGNAADNDGCSVDCRVEDICGDANLDGKRTAVDALYILRVAVGGSDACPAERCDLNGDERITASDALATLRAAVDPSLAPMCATA